MKTSRIYLYIFLSLLTSILLILSFPNFQISILAWVSFIPLFFAIDNSSVLKSFSFSYLSGIIFFGGTIYWLTYVTKLGYFLLIFYLALYFGLFGLVAKTFLSKLRTQKFYFFLFLLLPSLWISSEYVRAILFTGFPWAILGYTQYRTPIIIQIADVTGSYGVSFLIMMVNFVLYSYLYLFLKRTLSRHILISQTLILIIIMTFVLFYGYSELRNDDSNTGLKLSVIQGNIEQGKKWDTAYKDYILTRYEILTKEAAKDRPDLIIWPETSIPGLLDEEDIGKRIRKLAKDIDIPLFLGAITYESHFDRDLFFNSAVLFSLDGYIEEKYDKLHLVPFGEYVPFERYLPFIRDFINVEIGDYTKGREFTLFDIKSKRDEHFKYAALICFEDIFPALVRRFISNGANFLINITNDAWFKESSEQLQHAQASVFRAVENRVSVIRAANTGFSCYINPNGIIENSIYDKNTKGMYVPGYKTFELKISERSSFYTRYGDVFSYICIAFVLSALLTVSLGWRPT